MRKRKARWVFAYNVGRNLIKESYDTREQLINGMARHRNREIEEKIALLADNKKEI